MPVRENAKQIRRIVGIIRRGINSRIGSPKSGQTIDFEKLDTEIETTLKEHPWVYETGIAPSYSTTQKIQHWLVLTQMRQTGLSKLRQKKLIQLILAIEAKKVPFGNQNSKLTPQGNKFFKKIGIEATEEAYQAFMRALKLNPMLRIQYERWHGDTRKTESLSKVHVLSYAGERMLENYTQPILTLYRDFLSKKGVLE